MTVYKILFVGVIVPAWDLPGRAECPIPAVSEASPSKKTKYVSDVESDRS